MEVALAATLASAASGAAAVGGAALSYQNAGAQQKAATSAARQNTALARADAIAQRDQANEAAKIELAQYETERKAAALAAAQEQAAVSKVALATLSSAAVLRGANGLDQFSMTGRAIMAETLANAAADLETLQANAGRVDERLRQGQSATVLQAQQRGNEAERRATNAAITGNQQMRSAYVQANGQRGAAIASGLGGASRAGFDYLSRSRPPPPMPR